MKNWKAVLWGLAAGLPVCAATVWMGGALPGPFGPETAWGQRDPNGRLTPGERRQLMEDMRLFSMTDQDREALKRSEFDAYKAFMDFLKINAPNRYAILTRQELPPGAQNRNRLVQRWLNMEQMRTSQPELYDKMVQQFSVEDQLIGLAAKLRLSHRSRDGKETALEAEIHDQAAKLEELNLSQRTIQVQNAQRALAQQMRDLQNDTKNKDQLAEMRANQIIGQSTGRFSPDPAPVGQNTTEMAPADGN